MKERTTIDLLSSVINQSSISELYLYGIFNKIYQISWSNESKLETLYIDHCTHQQFCRILDRLPNLRSFSSNYYDMDENYYDMDEDRQIHLSISFHQLTSLTLRSSHVIINQLEYLLSLTRSLTYLHIMNYTRTFTFLRHLSQWEKFICQNLALLKYFKFNVHMQNYIYENVQDIEQILKAFRTSFWIEHKQWYVTCKYIGNEARSDLIWYTSTDFDLEFPDNLLSGTLSYITSTTKNDKMNTTWCVRLDLSEITDAISSHKLNYPTDRIFNNMTQLALDFTLPINSCHFLSSLTDFSQLTIIWLFITNHHYFELNIINMLLNIACNLRTIGISYDDDDDDDSRSFIKNLCSTISGSIENLKVRTTNIEYMQLYLQCVQYLSTVTFIRHRNSKDSWKEFIQWLITEERKFLLSNDHQSVQVFINECFG
ncbi:unnamed protein product [Rotaria sp. Silwood1]|nr:unnamed protein product [Rotaria sp. Silwood1]CAF1565527.1 unnamed protein product [Rotaria sp. Silwood1]